MSPVSPDPIFRQLARIPNTGRPEQPPTSAEAASIDPVDIAKSAGIGFVNGVVNAVGLPGDLLTGFGHFPNNLFLNLIRMRSGLPPLPLDDPDYLKWSTSGKLRHRLEDHVGELYQPQTRVGRYAETIGEMAPTVVGGEGLGAQAAGAALRGLPGVLTKHAVAPGIAVQALEEALPDGKVGGDAAENLSNSSSWTSCCTRRSAIPRQTYHTTMRILRAHEPSICGGGEKRSP